MSNHAAYILAQREATERAQRDFEAGVRDLSANPYTTPWWGLDFTWEREMKRLIASVTSPERTEP